MTRGKNLTALLRRWQPRHRDWRKEPEPKWERGKHWSRRKGRSQAPRSKRSPAGKEKRKKVKEMIRLIRTKAQQSL